MHIGANENIYLDYAAATPVDAGVVEVMLPYMTEKFANPAAPYAYARAVKANMEDARARIAHLMGAKSANVIFTAGATEANNLAFTAASARGDVIASAIEHPSIFETFRAENSYGGPSCNATILPVTPEGFVTPEALEDAITPQTELVSIALANGEIGTIQPMRELAQVVADERARRLREGNARPIYLHTDASQAAATCMINVSALGADLITVSAAKMYGPKQVGLLWARSGIELHPIVLGGGQESGLRSGTENVPGIMGFARAFELARELREGEARRLVKLRNLLQDELTTAFPWAIVAGPKRDTQRLHNLLHISFPGLEARRLVIMLDQKGVSVGTGSACAASKMQTSHVLDAIGASPEVAAGSLRITLGRPTTEDQVARAAGIMIDVIQRECNRVGLRQEGN